MTNTSNISKIYPTATDEVAKILGFDQGQFDVGSEDDKANSVIVANSKHLELSNEINLDNTEPKHLSEEVSEKTDSKFKAVFSAVFPYFLVFLVGLVGYYFFLSNSSFNLKSLSNLKPKETVAPLTAKDSAITALQKDSAIMEKYRVWISQYYFDISDSAVIDANADNSGNGLSNFHKYLLGLNPKSYDSIGLGVPDSESISQGINPLTGSKLTKDQQSIVDKYFDLEVINNRLAVEQLNKGGAVAGKAVVNPTFNSFNNSNPGQGNNTVQIESARDGLKSVQRNNAVYIAPKNVGTAANENPTGMGVNSNNLNLDIPGRLEIPSLNINVPVIWTKTAKNFDKDLQTGVVHYPGTALPGQIGTTYISGHSSNYAWAKGNYNKVFAKLGDLPDNTSFVMTVVDKSGKDIRFHYVVTSRKEFAPTDQEQFKNTGDSVVALSTCWPIGSTKSRLVVFGKLTQTEK